MSYYSFQSLIKKSQNVSSLWHEAIIILAGSLFIALCSQISFFLPWTTIPVSLQPQAVILLSAILGKKRAFAAISAYLLEGIMGAPVFALGGAGIGVILSPRGGYLLSYLLVSYLIGSLFDRNKTTGRIQAFLYFAIGNCIILSCGWLWLIQYIGIGGAWVVGVSPFIISDAFKIVLLTIIYPGVIPLSNKIRN